MPALLIKDFLQTQGLKLPADEIHVAYLTAQAVIKMGMLLLSVRFCGRLKTVGSWRIMLMRT